MRPFRFELRAAAVCGIALASCTPPPPAEQARAAASPAVGELVRVIEEAGDGPIFQTAVGLLKLEVCAPNVVRVAASPDRDFFDKPSLAAGVRRCDENPKWELSNEEALTLSTSELVVQIDRQTAQLTFVDEHGRVLLEEGARLLMPIEILGEKAHSVQQTWKAQPDEAFYGLGQHQQGYVNIRSVPLDLVQYNTEIVVPFVVSSSGYGIFWDNTSWTRWGNLDDFVELTDDESNYSGTFVAKQAGTHWFRTYTSGAVSLTLDGQQVIEHYRQGWLPGIDYAPLDLDVGEKVRVEYSHQGDMGMDVGQVAVQPPGDPNVTSLWSQVADGIDYYFVKGPDADRVIAGYRQLTGQASLLPKWALGLWQSRERYKSAEEVIRVLKEFRKRKIPLDTIVQDWQYWRPGTWGSHDFDPSRFPDPKAWIDEIHDEYDARLLISVWPKFHEGTDNFEALRKAGHLYPRNLKEGIEDFRKHEMSYYDAFDPAAREMYWSQLREQLFSLGIDAWWLDATEPEVVEGPYDSPAERRRLYSSYMHPTAKGSGARVLNAYSLMNSKGIYEGQRKVAPNQRVCILTRSAFAGQQRFASVSWSGDVTSTWTAMKKQIAAGLGFSASGIPYWTMDVGGFAVPPKFRGGDLEEWYELNTRWFQFGTFVPLLRVHGQSPHREMWTMGGDDHPAYQTHVAFTKLRYRLLPYLYSLLGDAHERGGTMMRPLFMDFPADRGVRSIADQYMFGPAFLVSPVTEFEARKRQVLLPTTPGGWYDFWSGVHVEGRTIEADAPLQKMPLFVRAGSIVPFGPEVQFALEKPADPITLVVYTGADGQFRLYEDDGLSYDYERGERASISISWDDEGKRLHLSKRDGSFEGMLERRTFEVLLITPERAAGYPVFDEKTKKVEYDGKALDVDLSE